MPTTKSRNSVGRLDPTRTGVIRRAFSKKLDEQWKRLGQIVKSLLVGEDAFGLVTNKKHSYCSTQINLEDEELRRLFFDYQKTINPDDVVELDKTPHVTVRYGLHSSPEMEQRVGQLVKMTGVQRLTVGKLSLFDTPDADVLKFEIDGGSKLRMLNSLMSLFPHTDTHPKYAPHMMVAYLKKGTGQKYLYDEPELVGKVIESDTLVYSDQEREQTPITLNARWGGLTSEEKLLEFKDWLREQFGDTVSGEDEVALWLAYIEDGYRRGAGRSYDDVGRIRQLRQGVPAGVASNRDTFLQVSLGRPESIEKVKLLAARTFEELKGLDETMITQLGRILVDGLITGKNPREIARTLDGTLQLGRNRAEVIARTELIRAHAEGQLTALEQLGVTELGVMVEWSTAGDNRVCPKCKPLQGITVKLEEARNMLPRHPRCRCAWIPSNTGESEKGQKRSSSQINYALRKSKEAGSKGEDWGANKPISKKRPKSVLTTNRMTQVQYVLNQFCATGKGGGVDPTCGKGGSKKATKLASGQVVTFIPHDSARGNSARYTTVMVSSDKLDMMWKHDKSYYIPKGGGGAEIEGRRSNFKEFLKKDKSVEASKVYMNPKTGEVIFQDGRHRFSVLRDEGAKEVAVTILKSQVKRFKALQ